MQPRESESTELTPTGAPLSPQASRTQGTAQAGGKRKQTNSGSTAAGRKIARKTAHSLIERRRRSKMNEEFGVLKDMIPACKGQEMHKLAILQVGSLFMLNNMAKCTNLMQASIDYLLYLEQCVADLQAKNNSPRPQAPPSIARKSAEQNDDDDDDDEEMEDDEERETTEAVATTQDRSASMISLPSLSQITTTTTSPPSVFSTDLGRHYSISSASQAGFSPYFHSNTTSPAFGPQLSHISSIPASAGPHRDTFGLGSPALKPLDSTQHLRQIAEGASELSEKRRPGSSKPARSEHELDQEATAALLMLNNDRRNWRSSQEGEGGRSNTGMSVRDLLSG